MGTTWSQIDSDTKRLYMIHTIHCELKMENVLMLVMRISNKGE